MYRRSTNRSSAWYMTLATWYAYGDGWSNTPFEMTDGEFWIYLLCPILFQVVVLYTKANHVRGKG